MWISFFTTVVWMRLQKIESVQLIKTSNKKLEESLLDRFKKFAGAEVIMTKREIT